MIVNDQTAQAFVEFLKTKVNTSHKASASLRRISPQMDSKTQSDVIRDLEITEADFLKISAEVFGLSYLSSSDKPTTDVTLLDAYGSEFFRSRAVVPLVTSGNRPHVLISRPFDTDLLSELRFVLGEAPELCLGEAALVRKLLRDHIVASDRNIPNQLEDEASPPPDSDSDSQMAKRVDAIIADAIDVGASDIHFEAIASGISIRFRIDGVLRPYPFQDQSAASGTIARLKLLSGMNISERRLPQDGRMSRHVDTRPIDIRVSSLPTNHGESVVCRLLDPASLRIGWEALGFEANVETSIINTLSAKSGMFVISGPTGSGKTTTLYTALQHLNDGRRKLISVEDPVEFDLDGIEQVQVKSEIGLNFARVLRTVLRQDPDVIMIGEIRDEETAEIACRAALVGRLVLATIHAGSRSGVVERLQDLGVSSVLIEQVLLAVLEQRLEPDLCTKCGAIGCVECENSGYRGRTLVANFDGAKQR